MSTRRPRLRADSSCNRIPFPRRQIARAPTRSASASKIAATFGDSSPNTRSEPLFTMPAFSAAIDSRVVPRIWV